MGLYDCTWVKHVLSRSERRLWVNKKETDQSAFTYGSTASICGIINVNFTQS